MLVYTLTTEQLNTLIDQVYTLTTDAEHKARSKKRKKQAQELEQQFSQLVSAIIETGVSAPRQ